MMEKFKFKKQYITFNSIFIIFAFGLLLTPIFISDRNVIYYIGVVDRMVWGICCIFNGIWNSMTNYYSIINNEKVNEKSPKWPWIIIITIGLVMIVTAFMGYGFNNVSKPL